MNQSRPFDNWIREYPCHPDTSPTVTPQPIEKLYKSRTERFHLLCSNNEKISTSLLTRSNVSTSPSVITPSPPMLGRHLWQREALSFTAVSVVAHTGFRCEHASKFKRVTWNCHLAKHNPNTYRPTDLLGKHTICSSTCFNGITLASVVTGSPEPCKFHPSQLRSRVQRRRQKSLLLKKTHPSLSEYMSEYMLLDRRWRSLEVMFGWVAQLSNLNWIHGNSCSPSLFSWFPQQKSIQGSEPSRKTL